MQRSFLGWWAGGVLLCFGQAFAAELDPIATDEQTLKAAKVASDGPGLLEYLRKRGPGEQDHARIDTLIRQLGDDDFAAREKATTELQALGSAAVPALRKAAKSGDVEIARRAEICLRQIKSPSETAITVAVLHLLTVRKPAGAVEALLHFLAAHDDEQVMEEIEAALAALAPIDSPEEKILIQTLEDKVPARRSAAAGTLCRTGGKQRLALVRSLLKDADATVRLRVALALADLWEQEAIPVLIALLVELPANQVWQAEEYLRRLAGAQAPPVVAGTDDPARKKNRAAWEAWWRATEGPRQLDFFRQRTPIDNDRNRIATLVRQLGDDDFEVREQATAALVQLGPAAAPMLRQAAKDADVEVSHRAELCLKQIEKVPSIGLTAAAARLVALRKPPGAIEVLLAYFPTADDEFEAEDLQNALTVLAFPDGKPDPFLVRALEDKLPLRRAAAAVALLRGGGPNRLPEARRLLQDPDPVARLRVALTLADLKDKEAIPVVIGLFPELPENQLWHAEDFLRRLAGDQGPTVVLAADAASRQKSRDAWTGWWREQGPRLDLTRLDRMPRLLGYTLLAEYTNGRNGRVVELAADGKTRWQLDNTPWPLDVQILPGNRLLLAEFYDNRVAERNLQGTILWQKVVNQSPIAARRLANGNTFIATQNQLLEVDREGKEVFTHNLAGIMAVQKLRDGRIACVAAGTYYLLDTSGKELKKFPVGQVNNYSAIDVLPSGRVVIPRQGTNEVVEFDTEGKEFWKASVGQPTSVMRLPNGHTLVACRDTQQVVELDRAGKTIWQHKADGHPWRAYRR